jgi:NAD(P)-dependent dehydrogenase (short-subunit alcohol dehydrogenase family)
MNENSARMFSLAGQVALITGGGSGLGYATAECMIEAGAAACCSEDVRMC